MSNSELITSILLAILFGAIAVLVRRFVLKKSIMFKIVLIMMFPLINSIIVGLFVGATGFSYFWWATLYAVAVMTIGFEIVGKMLIKPLKEMLKVIKSLSEGNLDVTIDEKFQKGEHEVAYVVREMIKLTRSLRNIATFANHIGKGELDVEYTLLGENDVLGNSLFDMRKSLQNAEKEQSVRAKEEEQRNWGTAGLAKFAEILRRDNTNMEALTYNVISNLVKYLNINQGGIFVLNESDHEEDRVLELKACYAFDRKKYSEKQIHPGDGLVGTCFLEGEPIYLTDVPERYINITSGLGKSNPRAVFICPLKVNDVNFGVLELASFRPFEPHHIEFVQKVSESIAATISSVRINIRTERLLEQSKYQAEEMANHEEELRQNMEEMQATQEEMRRREQEMNDTLAKFKEMHELSEDSKHSTKRQTCAGETNSSENFDIN